MRIRNLYMGALLALAGGTPPLCAAETHPELFGSVIYADGWTTQENSVGIYRIPTSEGMEFEKLVPTHIDASSGGVLTPDTYWTCNFVDFQGTPFVMVSGYDPVTWKETSFQYGDAKIISTGVAYDPVSKLIYGCFRNDTSTGYVFGTVNYETLTRVRICDLPRLWSAVGINRHGELFAIDELGDLYAVDKTDGAMTLIGSTGLQATHPSSGCIDYRSGLFYYALTAGTEGKLYAIDTTDASVSEVYHFPKNQEIVGLFTPLPDAEDTAPDSAANISYSFSGGSLEGTLTFTAPTLTYGGQPGTGELAYTLEIDALPTLSGDCRWGEELIVPVSVAAAGIHSFRLSLRSEGGKGPSVENEFFVGKDTPAAPEVVLAREGDLVRLRVTPVSETLHGGYADFAGMRYEAVRLPDNIQLRSIAGDPMTFEDILDPEGDLRAYSYEVRACYADVRSDATATARLWTGAATPPYESVFDTFEAAEPYIVLDANGDGRSWEWSEDASSWLVGFNRERDNDDWLLSPALRLKGGQVYKVRIRIRTYLGNPEYFEIAAGERPESSAMKQTLLRRTQLKSRDGEEFVVYLTPEEDGTRHVGVHSVSPASESWYLYVDSMTVEAGVGNDVPAMPESMEVSANDDGALQAIIRLTAPVKTLSGKPLESLDRIELYRDGELIHTFANPEPGADLSCMDRPATSGYHTYVAVPFNEKGEGRRIERKAYVGVPSPGRPAWASIEETATSGEVIVRWDRVTVSSDGTPMNPDLVRYDLMTVDDTHGGEAYTAAEGVRGDSWTLQVPGADKRQKFAYYAVKAITDTDYSLMTLTPFLPVGPAYAFPYRESFAGGSAKSLMRPDNGVAMWSIYTDDSGIPSHDGDRGMAAMFGELYGSDASLYTGKISLKDAKNPVLTFYTYNIADADADMNEIEVKVGVGTEFRTVRTVIHSELGEADGWYPVVVPLDEWVGKEIQLCFRGVTRNRKFTLIDDLRIEEGIGTDLQAGFLTAPSAVGVGEEFTVEANVENIGREAVGEYSVVLMRGEVEEARLEAEKPLAAGASATFRFLCVLNAAMGESSFRVLIDCPADEDLTNNESGELLVRISNAGLPAPRDLAGEADQQGVRLRWNEPDFTRLTPGAVTEDFEEWTPWTKEGEKGWTFVDRDRSGIGSIQNVVFPGIDYNSELSWFLLDSAMEGLGADYAAASGDKYLSTMFCLPLGDFQYVANDDWLISPSLYGGAQRISLKARSVNSYVAEESFEILWSPEDSADPSDFVSLTKVGSVPGQWTAYEFELPEGARRFAVRYDKTYGFMLHLDDVRYIPAGESDLTLRGYNVYRGEELLTLSGTTSREYAEDYLCSEETAYSVSALYSDGSESLACAAVRLRTGSGMRAPVETEVRIFAEGGEVVILGCAGERVRVYDAEGRLSATRVCSGEERIPVSAGVWVVSAPSGSVKLRIR